MKRLILFLCICIGLVFGNTFISYAWTSEQRQEKDKFMKPYDRNAYGLGIHSDSAGQPFVWRTRDSDKISPHNKVDPNAYGPGMGADEYGRAVIPTDPYDEKSGLD